jgi:2-phosphoglycerate kinase
MFGMSLIDSDNFGLQRPELRYKDPRTMLFMTGVTLSGKSSIAMQVASRIQGTAVQNMDMFRTWAQEKEAVKPRGERNPFVRYGSCDSFAFVGDGSYSPESLVTGFNEYAKILSAPLTEMIPRLDVQGAQHVLFEGVQLTPSVVSPFLTGDNKLIIVTATESALSERRRKTYGRSRKMLERYGMERILLVQEEITRQAREADPAKILLVDNSGDYLESTARVLRYLVDEEIVVKNG